MAEKTARLRVLHVTLCEDGGVARAIESIIGNTPQFEHRLVVPAGWQLPADEKKVHRLTGRGVSAAREIASLIRDEAPDLLHVHSSWAGLYARALRTTVPIIYQAHGYAHDDLNRGAAARRVFGVAERLLARRTTVVAVVSAREQRLALSLNRDSVVHMIPNVASATVHGHDAREHTNPRVVTVGRMVPQKSPEFFADVARAVRAQMPDVEFVWIGGADRDSEYPPILESAGVVSTGWVDQSAVSEELSRGTLYLHTASSEGFPLSVLEAAEHALPILVRNIPAFEGSGLATFSSVSEAAERVCAALRTPAALEDLARRSSRLATEHSPETQASAVEAAYLAAWGARRRV